MVLSWIQIQIQCIWIHNTDADPWHLIRILPNLWNGSGPREIIRIQRIRNTGGNLALALSVYYTHTHTPTCDIMHSSSPPVLNWPAESPVCRVEELFPFPSPDPTAGTGDCRRCSMSFLQSFNKSRALYSIHIILMRIRFMHFYLFDLSNFWHCGSVSVFVLT